MNIIYYDNHIVVVNKPSGIPTQKSREHFENLEDNIRDWLKIKFNKPGNVFLHAVHRLDLQTGGIVVFAKTEKALKRLNEIIKDGEFHKTYLAVIENSPTIKNGTLKHYLLHKNHFTEVSDVKKDGFKKALLEYSIIGENNGMYLAKIKLHTGRYHQIRAQFSFIGSPVLGDKKYGSKSIYSKDKIALIHSEVSFIHPVKKEKITFKVELPDEWPWNIFDREEKERR